MPRNIERDKREADRRKNQLIEAGFRLFSQNGIETVSLQKVADAANVSPATMYKYFLTKEKLLIHFKCIFVCIDAVHSSRNITMEIIATRSIENTKKNERHSFYFCEFVCFLCSLHITECNLNFFS